VIVKVRIDPTGNLAFATFHKKCEVNLTYLFAHEMIHCLQAKKYGIMKFNPFRHPDFWKLEGYPEYISRKTKLSSKNYSLANEIERYIILENKATDRWVSVEEGGCESPNYYYKGRLMVEYLMDIKHLSYDQILKDTVSENTIFKEMIKWIDSVKVVRHIQ
jgi:predicted metalloprotease with PDZ domain